MLRPKRPWGPPFTMLVGTFRQPTDPSQDNPGVVFMRDYTSQRWVDDHSPAPTPLGGSGPNGGIIPNAPQPTLDGVITVADNDFTTGTATVTVAEHTLIAGLDFMVGATLAATATNLATALDRFPDVTAAPSGVTAIVSVAYRPGPAAFEAQHLGTILNFTLAPGFGGLAPSAAQLEPPRF
jgi:hypothetical protein